MSDGSFTPSSHSSESDDGFNSSTSSADSALSVSQSEAMIKTFRFGEDEPEKESPGGTPLLVDATEDAFLSTLLQRRGSNVNGGSMYSKDSRDARQDMYIPSEAGTPMPQPFDNMNISEYKSPNADEQEPTGFLTTMLEEKTRRKSIGLAARRGSGNVERRKSLGTSAIWGETADLSHTFVASGFVLHIDVPGGMFAKITFSNMACTALTIDYIGEVPESLLSLVAFDSTLFSTIELLANGARTLVATNTGMAPSPAEKVSLLQGVDMKVTNADGDDVHAADMVFEVQQAMYNAFRPLEEELTVQGLAGGMIELGFMRSAAHR